MLTISKTLTDNNPLCNEHVSINKYREYTAGSYPAPSKIFTQLEQEMRRDLTEYAEEEIFFLTNQIFISYYALRDIQDKHYYEMTDAMRRKMFDYSPVMMSVFFCRQ